MADLRITTPRLFASEWRKLKGSLVALLLVAVPLTPIVIGFVVALIDGADAAMFPISTAAIWAYGMLPLGITAMTAVLAQIEHAPRAWDMLFSIPGTRRRIFLIKGLIAMLVTALWHVLLFIGVVLVVTILQAIAPSQMTGTADFKALGQLLTRMFGASLFMLMIHYGLAIYLRGFVIPLIVGVIGTFSAIALTAAKQGVWFPWLLSLNQLASDPARADQALALGVIGGMITLVAVQIVMQRREW